MDRLPATPAAAAEGPASLAEDARLLRAEAAGAAPSREDVGGAGQAPATRAAVPDAEALDACLASTRAAPR